MYPRIFIENTFKTFKLSFILNMAFICLITIHYFVINGIVSEEIKKTSIIKDDYSLIVTKTDKRRGNIFFSTIEFFMTLSELAPGVEAFVKSDNIDLEFSYLRENDRSMQKIQQTIPAIFISTGYLEAMNGRFIQGKGFSRDDIINRRPYVILSDGLVRKIFGDSDRAPSTVSIGGINYQVLGVWAFEASDTLENQSIFFPLTLANLFGDETKSYINNFIIRGHESAQLEKLKFAIDRIQMDAGNNPIRPEFIFDSPTISKQAQYIFSNNKVYLDLLIWIILLFFIFSTLQKTYTWISYSQQWSSWTFMVNGGNQKLQKTAFDLYFFMMSISLMLASLLSISIILFLHYFAKITVADGPEYHIGIFIYAAFIFFHMLFMKHRCQKIRYSMFQTKPLDFANISENI